MKRVRVIVIGVIIFGGVVSVLLHNRAEITAKAKPDILTAIPVSIVGATSQAVGDTLSLVGTITGNNDVVVVSETEGRVTRVLVQVGDHVRAGDVLVQVDDELKKAELDRAEVNFERAQKDFERFRSLREEHAATDYQKDNAWQTFKSAEAQLVTARKQYRDTRITSPISGIVTSRSVDLGAMVNKNTVIADVVDISRLKVKLSVAEQDVFKMKKGDPVEVTTDVYPGTGFDGVISTISAKADEAHCYPVEIVLPNNADHPLRAGMFGRVTFVALAGNNAIWIPREALVGSLKQPEVYVVDASSRARLRAIVVGAEAGSYLEVLSGLRDGENVVVNGQNNLRDSVTVDAQR